MIVQAIVHKPVRIATRLGLVGAAMHATVPRIARIVMNTSFRMFPDSDAAHGAKGGTPPQPSADQVAFQQLMRGTHFLRAVQALGAGAGAGASARCGRRVAHDDRPRFAWKRPPSVTNI
jgi:hypothetical protein